MQLSPLLTNILEGVASDWSGIYEVRRGEDDLGRVVMSEGQIAWAIFRHQTENLGGFLWHLGFISAEQLNQVRQLYDQHKGSKKLGTIMEEEGVLDRKILRRCLMLHVKFALANLLSHKDVQVTSRPSPLAATEEKDILFNLEEVLPLKLATQLVSAAQEEEGDLATAQVLTDPEPMAELVTLPGFKDFAVLSRDGNVLMAHLGTAAFSPRVLGVLLTSMFESSVEVASSIALGSALGVTIESSDGWLAARWINREKTYMAVATSDRSPSSRDLCERLASSAESIAAWMDKLER